MSCPGNLLILRFTAASTNARQELPRNCEGNTVPWTWPSTSFATPVTKDEVRPRFVSGIEDGASGGGFCSCPALDCGFQERRPRTSRPRRVSDRDWTRSDEGRKTGPDLAPWRLATLAKHYDGLPGSTLIATAYAEGVRPVVEVSNRGL